MLGSSADPAADLQIDYLRREFMTCTCPKCHAIIELDLPEVTDTAAPAACPACNTRFNLYRESFGARALHRSGEISCASCGSILGPQMHCASCGAQFPDYLVASLGRKKVRKEGKKLQLRTSPFPKRTSTVNHVPTLEMSMRPEVATTARTTSSSKYPKPLVMVSCALVLIALIAGGSAWYLKNKTEKAYAKNFILATYCLQIGIEKALKSSTRISTDWKQKQASGQTYTPRPTVVEERDFTIINNKLDPALQDLTVTPEKFAGCAEKLDKFKAVYAKLHSLVVTPGNSLPNFTDMANKADAENQQAIKEFRSGMPDEMIRELNNASLKFKILRPLLASR
jgi:hypothetical protein